MKDEKGDHLVDFTVQLEELSKAELIELVQLYSKLFLAVDGFWYLAVNALVDEDTATLILDMLSPANKERIEDVSTKTKGKKAPPDKKAKSEISQKTDTQQPPLVQETEQDKSQEHLIKLYLMLSKHLY